MTLTIFGVVLGGALLLWAAAASGEKSDRTREIKKWTPELARYGLRVEKSGKTWLRLRVVSPPAYARASRQAVAQACGQVLGGTVELRDSRGCVTATKTSSSGSA